MGALIGAFPSGATLQDEWITEEITTSKTWTVPAGVTQIQVRLFGGGAAVHIQAAAVGIWHTVNLMCRQALNMQ